MILAITGATGYIGERLVDAALLRGIEVIALTRRDPGLAALAWQPFDLSNEEDIILPAGVSAVVHLAAITDTAAVDVDRELRAARRLIAACTRIGARFLFVSSQTAREDAPTGYGQAKWRIEQETLAAGGLVVRPGQVYGRAERALFGVLVGTVRGLPVIPAFFPAPTIQPVHVDDLAAALLAGLERQLPAGVVCVGAPEPISFTRFLQAIATQRLRRFKPAIPVPVFVVRVTSRLIGQRLSSRVGLDRLTSLFELPPMQTAADLQRLGIALRPLAAGMQRTGDGRRAGLIREARAFLIYTLRSRPAPVLVRRYVRSVEQLRNRHALDLPGFSQSMPTLLALLDDPALRSAPNGPEFIWRLNAAVVLGEASPQGARRYLGLGASHGVVVDGLRMVWAVAAEITWRVARVCLRPLLRQTLRRSGL